MNGYFKPLRRKIGVITLGLACVFAAGWVRSTTVLDLITLPVRTHDAVGRRVFTRDRIRLQAALILLERIRYERDDHCEVNDLFSEDNLWYSDWVILTNEDLNEFTSSLKWVWRPFGLFGSVAGVAEWPHALDDYDPLTFIFIPYWSIVLPLTLLSAHLLLSRPRLAKPVPPIAENA